jgi:Tol biopolymer transport system component
MHAPLSTAEGAPSWAPDGRLLAFYRVIGGKADLWVAGADGRSARRLTRRAAALVPTSPRPERYMREEARKSPERLLIP